MIKKQNQVATKQELLNPLPTIEITVPEKVYITLMEMRTKSYELTVSEGDTVKVGQMIGERNGGYFTQPIFSTVSGTVGKIVKKFTYSGKKAEVLEITNDFKDTYDERINERTEEAIAKLTKDEIVEIVRENGIKGLGGAGFPTYIKLASDAKIDCLVINGVECEPYITPDYMAMKNNAYEIFKGLEYLMNGLNIPKSLLGVKETKVELLDALEEIKGEQFADLNVEIARVPSYYPQGWELELIRNTLGIDIPPRTLLSDYGLIELNVTTVQACYDAIKYNKPIIERYLSVNGDAVNNPSQMTVRVGTPVPHVIEACGGYSIEGDKVLVMGGPMMGVNLMMDDAILSITVDSLLVFKPEEYIEEPCVRCGSCVYSCPAGLQPVNIMHAVKNKDKDAAKALNVASCIECGLCSYVCTSKIHLTDFMRKAKKLV